MRVKLMEYDRPTLNGRIYSKEIVEKAVNILKESAAPIFGQVGGNYDNYPIKINLLDCGFEVKEFFFNDDEKQLEGEIKTLKNENGNYVKDLVESGKHHFFMMGYGIIKSDMVVSELKIVGFGLSVMPSSVK